MKKLMCVALSAAVVAGCSGGGEKIDIDSMKVEAIEALARDIQDEVRSGWGSNQNFRLEPVDLDRFGHHPCVVLEEDRAECQLRGTAVLLGVINGVPNADTHESNFDNEVAFTLLAKRNGAWRVVGHRAEDSK
ncbi:MAG: hypothetical protein ACXIUZ_00590 [Lysobacteraceae bacterium]